MKHLYFHIIIVFACILSLWASKIFKRPLVKTIDKEIKKNEKRIDDKIKRIKENNPCRSKRN